MMVTLCIIGIVYGALVALAQKDWKRLVAYSSVSHMAMVMIGMFALNPVGITGSIIQQLNHGISTGALFLIVGIVYERRHTREISEYGGLSKVMPVYAAIFLIMTMSSIGLPALNGFIGEFTILSGAFQIPDSVALTIFGVRLGGIFWAMAAVMGIVLGAAYMLWLYQRTMWGKLDKPENQKLVDLNLREIMTLAPLTVLAFWIGLYPKPIFRVLEQPVARIVQQVNHQWNGEAVASATAPRGER
jgi:NADH-quinone oxidoreductase subunit M